MTRHSHQSAAEPVAAPAPPPTGREASGRLLGRLAGSCVNSNRRLAEENSPRVEKD